MRIGVISKADAYGGGASRVAETLTALLNRAGHESDHVCSWSSKGFEDPHRLRLGNHLNRPIRALQDWCKKLGLPDVIPFELPGLLTLCRAKSYDLLHFHDLSTAISPLTLQYISRRMPVVWTLHDCSGFTGGCLHPVGCERFKTGCGRCPQLGRWPIDTRFDNSRLWRGLRKQLHAQRRVVLTTPSQWMADKACSSGMLRTRPVVISNGVDTDMYIPRNRSILRRELGLPVERLIVLLSAGNLLDEGKGTALAVQALRQARDRDPFLLLVGNIDRRADELLAGFDRSATGYVGDQAQLARIYGAADVFLFCSLADNQPLTVLETMAAGTPMIGFQTGGIPEVVIQDQTGFLVPRRDTDALIHALQTHLDRATLARWGMAARQRAVALYSQGRFLEEHVRLYASILSGHQGAAHR